MTSQNVLIEKELQRIFHSKQRERRRLARLPIEEKVRLVVELQKRANSILSATGRPVKPVWKI